MAAIHLAKVFLLDPMKFSIALIVLFLFGWHTFAFADEAQFRAMMEEYCIKCHGGEKVEANIDLTGSYGQLDLLKNKEVWDKVLDQLYFEDMPPKKPTPAEAEYDAMIEYVETQVNKVDWHKFHNPGRMTLARLTTEEYRNSIRDIFGIDLQAGAFLGKDPEGNTGFTNDRESLNFPLFAFDNFLREAERVVDSWLSYGRDQWEAGN